MRLFLCLFIVLAWTSGPIFGPKAPTLSEPLTPVPPAETRAVDFEAPAVDFDNLRGQARDALMQLRQSQTARHMAMASADGR